MTGYSHQLIQQQFYRVTGWIPKKISYRAARCGNRPVHKFPLPGDAADWVYANIVPGLTVYVLPQGATMWVSGVEPDNSHRLSHGCMFVLKRDGTLGSVLYVWHNKGSICYEVHAADAVNYMKQFWSYWIGQAHTYRYRFWD